MSRLAQTVSSRLQGAQRIPVRKKRGYGEGPTLHPPGLLQGTARTCSMIPAARLPPP